MSVISIILAILILGVLVIVHEFGHFIVARKNGVFVKEFSIGFGPRIVSHVSKKTGTRFSWKAIPFGGSCEMLGALEEEDDANQDERSYDKKSVWARMSISFAGPFFNFLLAFILSVVVVAMTGFDAPRVTHVEQGSPVYEAGIREGDIITKYNGASIDLSREIYLEQYMHPLTDETPVPITYKRDGKTYKVLVTPQATSYYRMGLSYYANEAEAVITEVGEDSPIAKAGLRDGDVITSINGETIASGKEMGAFFDTHVLNGEPVELTYLRHGVEKKTRITPQEETAYQLGFTYNAAFEKTNALDTLKYSFVEMKYQVVSIVKSLGYLFSGNGSLDMLSGPVGIVEVIGSTYDASAPAGFMATLINMLSIVIILSMNLGILNLLPLPALDGGKLVLLIIEAIRRKPIKKKYEGIITVVGAVLIMALAVVVLVNDVIKLF